VPMIDVYGPADVVPADAVPSSETGSPMRCFAPKGSPRQPPFHLANTAAFVHRLPETAVATAPAGSARVVRVQIITPPGVLSRDGQRQLTADATAIVAEVTGDPGPSQRTWMILSEATEGGWGVNGTAFGVPEFTALATGQKP
jgi:phenylpyruvate tautomerase PptA (4-oxalocrotonate tautomerase family)